MTKRSTTPSTKRGKRATRAAKFPSDANRFTFDTLVQTIATTHDHFAARTSVAINIGLTLRNWTIGCHIQEFEQRGQERAEYGARLFENLSARLQRDKSIKYHPRELRRCRQFYNAYPQIRGTLSPESRDLLSYSLPQHAAPPSDAVAAIPAERLLTSLSFSHFLVLLEVDDPFKRIFYETAAIRGNWTCRELSRQIGALLFERTALSRNTGRVVDQIHQTAEVTTPENTIRDPYVFEFLGLKARDVLKEGDLEQALAIRSPA